MSESAPETVTETKENNVVPNSVPKANAQPQAAAKAKKPNKKAKARMQQQQQQQQQKPQQQQQQKKPEPVKEEVPVPFFSEELKDVPTITKLFPQGGYPEGEIQEYTGNNLWRSTSAEKKEAEKIHVDTYESIRKAAEVHRMVRQDAVSWIKPGMKLIDICKRLETRNKHLVEACGLDSGIAFPTGCSINRCAAHYTPNTGDNTILGKDDVVKFDFGTHVNGYIVDCAWTMNFNPMFDNLVQASREATNAGIKAAGIDVRLSDIGAAIQEVMESYECEINGKTYPIKSIRNLTGHSIDPYVIHAGKGVPIVANDPDQSKMEEGEFYAIETFGSTGKGKVVEEGECSHYMKVKDAPYQQIRMAKTAQLYKYIGQKYSTLAFCRRWLDEDGQDQNAGSLRQLVGLGLVTQHPPLVDVAGSYTSQMEHTILLRPTCKEVISRGMDY